MIGKSAASWQQVGNGAAEAAGDEKGASGGQKRAFRTLSFCSFCFDVSSFPPCFYVIPTLSLPFLVFLLPGKADGRAARVKKEDEKMRIRKKIFAKVPVWWQEKPANRATFAAET
ncbi:hypothetical protein GAP46_18235 [Bacteroides uniformis]|uniref:hypothetical protein n=1 Tax=Bacteroides TaxID=816 RepID=UPI00125D4869|nr:MULTISPECIES: hypothetical protein [Bacteroides]KAB4189829.1 hypothetical protein GAP51_17980 [Bacteroides uniformis]KAB4191199.1 hypothetical protein GAQ09_17660 [Bacteroides uniformis]KAB4198513.1 hypothetical protein GAQ12_17920 [Bacteroides uniformis]KAB4201040.1 hypothetical protein GAP52_18295 [Bacteroides uniformis]KAB4227762.1 hypothetical protein GAP46_18235 [Bacteroides uniformis]